MQFIDPNDPRRSEVEPVQTESDALPLSLDAGTEKRDGDASAWLPMVRDLMATGLSLQQAVDQLAALAVVAHRMEQAQANQAAVAPIAHRLKFTAADAEGGQA